MATEHSAAIIGLDGQVGRLAPGYKADIVFLDLSHLNFVPLNDPTNQIVLTENGASVDSVMVGGRLVLDHGRFPHVDVEAVRRKVEARVDGLRAANVETKALALKLEQAVATYCVGLARTAYHVERKVPGGQS